MIFCITIVRLMHKFQTRGVFLTITNLYHPLTKTPHVATAALYLYCFLVCFSEFYYFQTFCNLSKAQCSLPSLYSIYIINCIIWGYYKTVLVSLIQIWVLEFSLGQVGILFRYMIELIAISTKLFSLEPQNPS